MSFVSGETLSVVEMTDRERLTLHNRLVLSHSNALSYTDAIIMKWGVYFKVRSSRVLATTVYHNYRVADSPHIPYSNCFSQSYRSALHTVSQREPLILR